MSLPDLPPRQRRAFSGVLLALGSYPEGQVTASRGELLSRAGKLLDGPEAGSMPWPTWLRALKLLEASQLVRREKGDQHGHSAGYTLTAEGRAAHLELVDRPSWTAPDPVRGPPVDRPRTRSGRARSSSSSSGLEETGREAAAAAAREPVDRPADRIEGLSDEIMKRLARALLQELALALLGHAPHRDLKPENAPAAPVSPPPEPASGDRDMKPANMLPHPALTQGPRSAAVQARRHVEAALVELGADPTDPPDLPAAASADLQLDLEAGTARKPFVLAKAIVQRMRSNPEDVARALAHVARPDLSPGASKAAAEAERTRADLEKRREERRRAEAERARSGAA